MYFCFMGIKTIHKVSPEFQRRQIKTEFWKPSHPEFEYPEEFINWVNSVNKGWQHAITYEPLELYRLQAQQWLEDETTILDYYTEEDQEEWLRLEIQRCEENTLYFCNKYGWVKEDKADNGMLKYEAWEAQEVLLFLFDCGYSFMIGKARQIGFTTTMCLAGMKKVNLTKSYFIKFITHSQDKGIEIFRDKVKWTYNKLPDFLATDVKNWTDSVMSFEKKGERKGREEGAGQRFQVDAPSITAINGGSPSAVFVDEIGLFEIFGQMMNEARPALFKFNPETGKMTMQQQFIAWGTSGDMDKGGAVFELLFRDALSQWRERNFEHGIIPLFFNAFARRGVDKAFLEKERSTAMALKDTKEGEAAIVQYYQAYPITIDDMFIRKAKTLVPLTKIQERLSDIYGTEDLVEYGYFEPIMDISQPTPDLMTPYRIIGAKFIRSEVDHVSTSCCIIHHPPANETWKNRWYQGTDPINSESGHSKMSSAIWDSLTNTPSAVLFHRERKFKETYLQCMLMGLYYDQMRVGGVPELIENNIGDMYLDFQEVHGFKRKFIPNVALPEYMHTPGKWFGISNKTNTAPRIIAKLEDMIEAYGDRIDIPWFWEQLKTFVEKDLKGATGHRQSRYQAYDLRVDYDDVIFSIVFAYIAAISHARREPINIREEGGVKKITKRYIQNAETGWRKTLADVREDGTVVKIYKQN